MKKKEVVIILENCESYTFKPDDIIAINLEGLSKYYFNGELHYSVEHTLLIIDGDAKPKYDIDDWGEVDWKDRFITYKDITHIRVNGEDYSVKWNSVLDETNLYQKDFVEEFPDGSKHYCFIISPKKKKLSDFEQ